MPTNYDRMASPMMKKGVVIVATFLLLGCPPPFDIDLFNNTGVELVVHLRDRSLTLAPGASFVGSWLEVFAQRPDPKSGGSLPPILEIEHSGSVVEYQWKRVGDETWVNPVKWGKHDTAFVQIDRDLTLRIAKPGESRPVSLQYPQPGDWPLMPIGSVR